MRFRMHLVSRQVGQSAKRFEQIHYEASRRFDFGIGVCYSPRLRQ